MNGVETNSVDGKHHYILKKIARRVMIERGLLPDFSSDAIAEVDKINASMVHCGIASRDLRRLLWCSIDNDDSLDLDQLTVAVPATNGTAKILVAIADVSNVVRKGSAIDNHAGHNTASVYTTVQIFPMLPERLSNDLTSLNFETDRLAIVIEMVVGDGGSLGGSNVFYALVRNYAKLAYNSVASWLEGKEPMPESVSRVEGLAENLRLQDRIAQKMKYFRHIHGALNLETIESRPLFEGDEIKDFKIDERNRAKDIIEDFMIAANGVVARYLASRRLPSLRRIVRTPKRWDRIVELALEQNHILPQQPDSKALNEFLTSAKAADPVRFPDLCLSVIKLLGAGEYVVELPGSGSEGHFGLAVKDYAHSTAPNRRYPDLITQRLLVAAVSDQLMPYTIDELETLAKHCTAQEDVVKKVERQVGKCAAAMLLSAKLGEKFDAIVTGASNKGTWVRLLQTSIEGKLVRGFENVDVGQRLRVQLIYTDIEHGYVDFIKID